MDNMEQYIDVFIEESKENLLAMNTTLLDLEKDLDNIESINVIFRVAHTLKGMSATMGFNNVASLTHEMENLLDVVRHNKLQMNGGIIDILFECFDSLESFISNIETNGKDDNQDVKDLVKKIENTINGEVISEQPKKEKPIKQDLSEFEHILEFANSKNMKLYNINIELKDNCLLKSARAYIIFNTLEQSGEIIKSIPPAEDIEKENFENEFSLVFVTNDDESQLYDLLMNISDVNDVKITEMTENSIKKEEIIVEIEEKSNIENKVEKTIKDKLDKNTNKEDDKKQSKTVRVDIDRLDNLMNLVSELIIIKTRLEDTETRINTSTMNETVQYLERITTNLHDAVMKVRMVPIERTFNRFPRMVRDLSKELGKEIDLIMTGKETEVDRTVIDEIGEPLIHLIRNSLDHGIETKEKRIANGKPETGTVHLRAFPDGNTVVIEVEDDGNGIDAEKILKKALEKGIVDEKTASTMDNKDMIDLLFAPGFSTAETITDISGRGVGLDVVRAKIQALNGTVEVKTELGKGSKFLIRLPLTLAIIQALMVSIEKEKYAIPLNNIKEITTINVSKITKVQEQDVVLYRNKALPIIKLGEILNVKDYKLNNDEMTVVVVKKGDVEAGFVVDGLIGQQEIVIKSLGKYLGGIKAIAGATILGNGSVALIVDTNQLI